ncbi:MAG: class I SAM-dependent methyltransferase, partial [Chloroflexi bacterium]
MFEKSAKIYDLLYTGAGIKDYGAEAAEVRRLVTEYCPTATTLLDVACGTGAHLLALREWFAVEGVDVSPAMLEVAGARLPGIPLHLADMRTLDLGRTFDAVICLFSSIGYILEPDELRSTIARLAAHLNKPGVLILDGWVRPDAWSNDFRGDPDLASDDDMTVVRLSLTRRSGMITQLDLHHLVRTATEVEYFLETHRLAL